MINYELYTNELTAILVFGFILGKYFSVTESNRNRACLYILYNTLILVAIFCVMLQTQEKVYGWKPWTVSNMCLIDIYQRQIVKFHCGEGKGGRLDVLKINCIEEEVITL